MNKEWKARTLGEVCSVFLDGDWIESKDQSSSGIRLIQTGNVGEGVFKDRKAKARYISEETSKRLNCTEIVQGDCLISRLPEPVGRACLLPETDESMITAVDCSILRFNETLESKYFIYYSLSSQYLSSVDRQCSGATRKRISRKKLMLIEIPLPSILEQKRIVKILDEKFEVIDQLKRVAEAQLSSAKDLFESRLNEVFASDIKCKQVLLVDILKLEYGKPLDRSERSAIGAYPVYGANGIKAYSEKYFCDQEGIVVGRKGSAGEVNITHTKFWPLDVTYFVTCDRNQNNLVYIFYLLKSLKLQQYATGVKPGLNRNDAYAISINLKSLDEQLKVVKKLDRLSKQTKDLEVIFLQKVTELEELKKSYLHQAFSGNL